jgi:uncharacterized membrane protein YkvA (DUF1232 family)
MGMTGIFDTLRLLIVCGSWLLIAFLVLLAMPQSRLREVVMPFVGWGVSALSVAYILMPVDVMPEAFFGPAGLIDDAVALAVAIGSGMAASNAHK